MASLPGDFLSAENNNYQKLPYATALQSSKKDLETLTVQRTYKARLEYEKYNGGRESCIKKNFAMIGVRYSYQGKEYKDFFEGVSETQIPEKHGERNAWKNYNRSFPRYPQKVKLDSVTIHQIVIHTERTPCESYPEGTHQTPCRAFFGDIAQRVENVKLIYCVPFHPSDHRLLKADLYRGEGDTQAADEVLAEMQRERQTAGFAGQPSRQLPSSIPPSQTLSSQLSTMTSTSPSSKGHEVKLQMEKSSQLALLKRSTNQDELHDFKIRLEKMGFKKIEILKHRGKKKWDLVIEGAEQEEIKRIKEALRGFSASVSSSEPQIKSKAVSFPIPTLSPPSRPSSTITAATTIATTAPAPTTTPTTTTTSLPESQPSISASIPTAQSSLFSTIDKILGATELKSILDEPTYQLLLNRLCKNFEQNSATITGPWYTALKSTIPDYRSKFGEIVDNCADLLTKAKKMEH